VSESEKIIQEWYKTLGGKSLLEITPLDAATAEEEVGEAIRYIKDNSTKTKTGSVKKGFELYKTIMAALVVFDERGQIEETGSLIGESRGVEDLPARLQQLLLILGALEKSSSPSKLAMATVAAEMVVVAKRMHDTPSCLGAEQLEALRGRADTDIAKVIKCAVDWLGGGALLPPGRPPDAVEGGLDGWGTMSPLALQIRWWQLGLLWPPIEDSEL
jgi:hypothetical protein